MMEAFRPPYSTGQGSVSQRRCASFLLNCGPNCDCCSAPSSDSVSNWSYQPGGSSSFRKARTSPRNASSSAVNLNSIVPPVTFLPKGRLHPASASRGQAEARPSGVDITVGGRARPATCLMRLTLRPKFAPAQAVEVQVVLGLAGVVTHVRRHAVPALGHPHVFRHLADSGEHPRHDGPVLAPYRRRRWQVLARDDEEVNRCLPPGVVARYVERQHKVVLVQLGDL